MIVVEHLREGRLDYELAKCDELREPPVPVTAWLLVDSAAHDGLLYGWAANPNGGNDGWRGLVGGVREFTPGFAAEFLTWVRAEDIAQRRVRQQDESVCRNPRAANGAATRP